jgi:undecaprenyl pyrophosphate phosphatase UppP
MNGGNFFAELKRRNVYKVAIAYAIVGWLSIRWLLNYISRHSLYVFSAYCAAVGLLALILQLVK